MSDKKVPIVLDFGTAYTKIAFAGDSTPRKIIKTSENLFPNLKEF